MDKEKYIMSKVKEHHDYLIAAGFDVVCTCLQGSQNYGLDEYSEDYMSDIDTKSIVLPTVDSFIDNIKPVSEVIVMEDNSHAEVKDIRVMFDMFKKENISYIELLFTDYKIINPKWEKLIQPIFAENQAIAALNKNQFLRCIAGMAYEKNKALCHPYPGIIDKIEKYGFDGKQLSHCIRLYEFIARYVAGEPIAACYKSNCRTELMLLKKQRHPKTGLLLDVEEAKALSKHYMEAIKEIKDNAVAPVDEIKTEAIEILDKVKHDILKEKLKLDLEEK